MRFAWSLYRTQSFCNDWNVTRVSQDEGWKVREGIRREQRTKVVPWAKDHVHCTLCTDYISKHNMDEHMFKNHVREPAKRDLAMVAKGDNTRVKCSYSGSECKLDKDVHRISNGFFNDVGKSDPSLWGQVPVLVMCHTRELAFQISKEYERFSKFLPAIKVGVFFWRTCHCQGWTSH